MDARAPRGACGDVGVSGHAEASRTLPALAHAVAVRGQGLLEHWRHVPEADVITRTRPGASAARHRRPHRDVTGTVFRCDTRASDAPVVAADASARPQAPPRGHRRARCT